MIENTILLDVVKKDILSLKNKNDVGHFIFLKKSIFGFKSLIRKKIIVMITNPIKETNKLPGLFINKVI